MASKIEVLCRQAIKTFSRRNGRQPCKSPDFEENFNCLVDAANNISASDVCLEQTLSLSGGTPSRPGVSYVCIYNNHDLSVGIFVLRPHASLPLHNHPGMRGILKMLTGRVEVQSYTPLETFDPNSPLLVCKKHQLVSVDFNSSACLLDSSMRNLHEIKNRDGHIAAFLDILAPPYTDGPDENGEERDCFYYQVGREYTMDGQSVSCLEKISSPKSYICDSGPYKGPSVGKIEENTQEN
jgi:cysteamine dioxygenase